MSDIPKEVRERWAKRLSEELQRHESGGTCPKFIEVNPEARPLGKFEKSVQAMADAVIRLKRKALLQAHLGAHMAHRLLGAVIDGLEDDE